MSLQIYTNQFSTLAQSHLSYASKSLTDSVERLSSGLRINHAKDDASGLTISDELRGQIKGQFRASMNAQDAISYLQTAESGMQTMSDMLQRMREIAVQAGNSTYTANDRRELQHEINQLKTEINKVSEHTEFNTKKLLNGSTSGLWSSSSLNVEAVFTGMPREGNYKIDFSVDPGQNAVYKTNMLFNMAEMEESDPRNAKLESLDAFYNSDGHFLLENTQTITIYGNNTQADITLEGKDTLGDFVNKLSDAIANKLHMGATGIAESDLVQIITSVGTGNKAVLGTIVFQSTLVGTESEFRFSGDEALMNVLGISTIQAAKNSEIVANVSDAHTGNFIGSDTVSDQVLRGVIKGVDVSIKSQLGLTPSFDSGNGKITFAANYLETAFLHIADRATTTTIAGNEGQMFDISIGRLDSSALGIDNAFVLTVDDAHRAISKFEEALGRVTTARALIGAQVNHLEYTMKNLSVTRANMTSAEARIRNLDMADESTALARNQILLNAATSVLAQANQVPAAAMELIGSIK